MLGNDTFTKLLLHGDGSDTSTTVTDSSGSAHTVTANGNAQIDTAQKKFGTGSILFDGNGDYLTIPDHDDFNLGSGYFTIDFWVRFAAVPGSGGSQILFDCSADGTNRIVFSVGNTTGTFSWSFTSTISSVASVVVKDSPGLVINTWYHIAIVKDAAGTKIYQDAAQIGTTFATAYTAPDIAAVFTIGRRYADSGGYYYFNGWLEEFRISKGIARTDFVPLTTEAYNDSIVAEPFISTGSMRVIEKVVAEPLISTSSIVAPVITGIIYAVLAPAVLEISGTCAAGVVSEADAINTIPMARCEAGTGAYAYCTIPMATCEATAFTHLIADVECRIPMADVEALVGAKVVSTIPMATCEATAMHHPAADVELRIPMARCEATAIHGAVSDIICTIPMAQCEAYAYAGQKADTECLIPMAVCESFAMAGAVGWGECTIPMAACEATAWAIPDVDVECSIPMAICEAMASNQKRNQNYTLQYARW